MITNFCNKHYVRTNDSGMIKHGFSDAFEQPLVTDRCINENGGRHFELNGEINPPLIDNRGIPIYKYENGKVLQRTTEEIQVDEAALPAIPKSELQVLKETVDMLILSSLGGN